MRARQIAAEGPRARAVALKPTRERGVAVEPRAAIGALAGGHDRAGRVLKFRHPGRVRFAFCVLHKQSIGFSAEFVKGIPRNSFR